MEKIQTQFVVLGPTLITQVFSKNTEDVHQNKGDFVGDCAMPEIRRSNDTQINFNTNY